MIRLPKKIKVTIESNLTTDYVVTKRIIIDNAHKAFKVNLIVLRIGYKSDLKIMRYFADNSYDILGGFTNIKEVIHELANQVNKLSKL